MTDNALKKCGVKHVNRFREIIANAGSYVKNACTVLNSLDAFEVMERELKHGKVRVYQFVKVMGDITQETLVEFFIRGSALVCKNNEDLIDIVIPIFYPRSEEEPISSDRMGAIVIQVKLRTNFLPESDKVDWLEKTSSLHYLNSSEVPSVALFCELGEARDAEFSVPSTGHSPVVETPTRLSSQLQVVDHGSNETKGCLFGLFSRRLSVEDIFSADVAAQESFRRLLESIVDPSDCMNVDELFRKDIRKMFKVQPYLICEDDWSPVGSSVKKPKI